MNILKPNNTKAILRSVDRVFKTKNIDNLTLDAYRFLMNMSGFIAHYDINGFKHYYSKTSDLANDILNSSDSARPAYWISDFFVKSYGMAYCVSKMDTISGVAALAAKHLPVLQDHDDGVSKDMDIATARMLLAKHGVTH